MNQEEISNLLKSPNPKCQIESISSGKDLLKIFLTATKNWDGNYAEFKILISTDSVQRLSRLINSARVELSRIRSMYRAEGKSFKDFSFGTKYSVTEELDEFGNPFYELSLSKITSAYNRTMSFIDDLL